jgi:hypothetical protein
VPQAARVVQDLPYVRYALERKMRIQQSQMLRKIGNLNQTRVPNYYRQFCKVKSYGIY